MTSVPGGDPGVPRVPQDATDATSLLRNADGAMYQSKKSEPGGSIVYASEDRPISR
jgi:predicted signal transduction protein with EAL and GGDEF domain